MRNTMILLSSLVVLAASPVLANDADPIANLSSQGREAFRLYSQLNTPKAFAVAPDGAHGFHGGRGSADHAMAEALRRCQKAAGFGTCEVVSMNDEPMIAAGVDVAQALDDMPTNIKAGLRDEAVREYRLADGPKALAMSEDGSWGWMAGAVDKDTARSEALRYCAQWSQSCAISEVQ